MNNWNFYDVNIFAWSHFDMQGIDLAIAYRHLQVTKKVAWLKLKKKITLERHQIVNDEVSWLLQV